jgi:hypothetical protein
MPWEHIDLDVSDSIATVTLNRPDLAERGSLEEVLDLEEGALSSLPASRPRIGVRESGRFSRGA